MEKLTDTDILRNVTDEELVEAVKVFTSTSAFLLHKVGRLKNGTTHSLVSTRIKSLNLKWKSTAVKWPSITKECPVCDKEFTSANGDRKSYEQVTCSRGCANTYFMSGEDHPNYNPDSYRNICFKHHDKKCIICGEDRLVEVHHFDLNHDNNAPENLVPLCATHHQYVHSRFYEVIKDQIEDYVRNYNNIES